MSENTTIEWCDYTFNPWEGCTKVSPGCANCYAEKLNHRFGLDNWGPGKPRRGTSKANWRKPLRWNREAGLAAGEAAVEGFTHERPRVFCASLADWMDKEVPIEWLADLLKLIHATPNLDWLLLTKRPGNFVPRMVEVLESLFVEKNVEPDTPFYHWLMDWRTDTRTPANVWIGTSVEDQQRADERIPALLKIPARVRFLSMEPLLEPVVLKKEWMEMELQTHASVFPRVHWCIVGGESKGRICNVDWIRGVVRQCQAAGVKCFVKQLGTKPMTRMRPPPSYPPKSREFVDFGDKMNLKHPKGGDPAEWPEDLRVREFPVSREGDAWMEDAEARREFEAGVRLLDEELKPVTDALEASGRLGDGDLEIRINTRDCAT